MPEVHGVWQTVHHRFAQWRDQGVFQALMDGPDRRVRRAGQADLGLVGVDSTVARAHHDAAAMAVDKEACRRWRRRSTKKRGHTKSTKGRTAPEGSAPDPARDKRRADR